MKVLIQVVENALIAKAPIFNSLEIERGSVYQERHIIHIHTVSYHLCRHQREKRAFELSVVDL